MTCVIITSSCYKASTCVIQYEVPLMFYTVILEYLVVMSSSRYRRTRYACTYLAKTINLSLSRAVGLGIVNPHAVTRVNRKGFDYDRGEDAGQEATNI